MTFFVILTVISGCVVLAIAWARYRANTLKQVSRKPQDILATPEVPTAWRENTDGIPDSAARTSEEVSLSSDVLSFTDTSANQDLAELGLLVTTSVETYAADAVAAKQTTEEAGPSLSEFVNSRAVVAPLQEATNIDESKAPTDHLSAKRIVPIEPEANPTTNEARAGPSSPEESHSDGPLAQNDDVPTVPEPPEISKTISVPVIVGENLDTKVISENANAETDVVTTEISIEACASEALETEIAPTRAIPSASRYRAPRLNVGPTKRKKSSADSRTVISERPQRLLLTIRGRIHRDHWSFGLLAQKPPASPQELEARVGATAVPLIEANDEWYEAAVDGLYDWLNGVVLLSKNNRTSSIQWQLTGRDIHILAADNAVSGWASTTRLFLGRKHLVLCREQRGEEVAGLLREAGCKDVGKLDVDVGAPAGWVLFWPVVPMRAVAPVAGQELLNLLRPLPDLQISFEGGLPLQSSTWMVGYPPKIRVVGELGEQQIILDEEVATRTDDGDVRSVSYAEVGDHYISVGGRQSRKYTIVEPELNLEEWSAFDFPRGSICGALVKSVEGLVVTIPASNPLLIGAKPGQVYICPSQPGNEWTAFPAFEPVWALPADPLRCNKKTSRIILLNVRSPADTSSRVRDKHGWEWRWVHSIRSARRKGLQLKEQTDGGHELWLEYAQAARDMWRRSR